MPEQALREANLEVEVTPIERRPHSHLPEKDTAARERYGERQCVRRHRSKEHRECQYRQELARLSLYLVEVARRGSPLDEREFFNTLFKFE